MNTRTLCRIAAMLLAGWMIAPSIAQDAAPPPATNSAATQPADTQPAPDPLRSPYEAIHFFLDKAAAAADAETEEDAIAAYLEASECLDLSAIDPADWPLRGPELARQLAEILGALRDTPYFDPEDKEIFPIEAGAGGKAKDRVQSFGRSPIVLVLERIRVEPQPEGEGKATRRWVFPAAVVAEIPRWHESLDVLIEGISREPHLPPPALPEAEDGLEIKAFRSPREVVRLFMDRASREQYAAARRFLDFSGIAADVALDEEEEIETLAGAYAHVRNSPGLVEEVSEAQGVTYVDALALVLEQLQSDGTLVLDEIEKEGASKMKPTWAIARAPFLVVLARQGDADGPGFWRFAPQTVRAALRMAAPLKDAPTPVAPGKPAATVQPGVQPATPTAEVAPVPAAPPSEFDSRESTYATFRDAMESGDAELALKCLNLSDLSPSRREFADVLAGKLWLCIQREELISGKAVPDPVFPAKDEGRIEIRRVHKGEREGDWLFSTRTVRDIGTLYRVYERQPIHEHWENAAPLDAWQYPSLRVRAWINREFINPRVVEITDEETGIVERELIPRSTAWLGRTVWGLMLWQWIGIVAALLVGVCTRLVSQLVLPRIARRLMQTEGSDVLPTVVRRAMRPTSNLLAVAAVWFILWVGVDLGTTLMVWLWPTFRILMAVVGVWAAYRLVDVVMGYFAARAARTVTRMDDVLVPLVSKTIKVVVFALGFIFLVNAFGYEVDKWLAAFGVGGLAVSFAAKDTIANFFGSLNVVLDKPFQVGDWVEIGSAEGTVEAVGLRSCKIRTFANSQIIVPNSEIMNATIQNWQRRRYRRTYTWISVTYDTSPETLEAFCEGIREIVRQHPLTRKDYYHVYVQRFAAASIDIMVYIFHECPDWSAELRERHRFLLDVMRLAKRLGVEFAFPTQTIHLAKEGDGDPSDERPVHIPGMPDDAMTIGREQAAAIVAGNSPDAPGGK